MALDPPARVREDGATRRFRGSGAAGRRRGLSRALQSALFLAIVAGIFLGILPRIADLDHVWGVVGTLGWGEMVVLVLLGGWNVVTYWPMLVAAMPGLTLGQAAVVCQSSTTVAMTVPGGGAVAVGVSYAMYTSWGFSRSQVALSALATFVANMAFKLVLPVISVALLVLSGGQAGREFVVGALAGAGVLAAGLGLVVVTLRTERSAGRAGALVAGVASAALRLAGRPSVTGWEGATVRFRRSLLSLLRSRGRMLVAFELVSQLSVYLVLLATVRFVGVPEGRVSWTEVLVVFAFVRLASALPIIPGNVGLAELGYIGGFVLAGSGRTEAVAAVLVFRFLTYYAQIPIGAFTYVAWRRARRWRPPAEATGATGAAGAAGAISPSVPTGWRPPGGSAPPEGSRSSPTPPRT